MLSLLMKFGMSARNASLTMKGGPVIAVVITAVASYFFRLDQEGVALVGNIPRGMPNPSLPGLSRELIAELFWPAVLISIVSFVESISVGETLATRRRQRINPDQELVGLGMSNVTVSFGGGFPIIRRLRLCQCPAAVEALARGH